MKLNFITYAFYHCDSQVMKLPRFQVSNDFYNPTYLLLEICQVTIKPAKRRCLRICLDLIKQSGVRNVVELSSSQEEELCYFNKEKKSTC